MLKKYLQTLIESVFTNKKQWIGRQGFIDASGTIVICYGAFTFDSYKYIAPADGYIFLDSGDDVHSMAYIQGAGLAYESTPNGERHAVWAPVFAGQTATLCTYPTYCSKAYCAFIPLAGEN